jgi:hypothetical protein
MCEKEKTPVSKPLITRTIQNLRECTVGNLLEIHCTVRSGGNDLKGCKYRRFSARAGISAGDLHLK